MDWGLLTNTAVLGATIGAAAAGINGWFQRRFERHKWHSDLFVRPQLEALRNLHRRLVESHYAINMRVSAARPRTLTDYERWVEDPKNDFFNALVVADLYLDDETKKLMQAVLGSLRQVSLSIWLRLPQDEFPKGPVVQSDSDDARVPDWRQFVHTYEAAHKRLGEILNPKTFLKIGEGA